MVWVVLNLQLQLGLEFWINSLESFSEVPMCPPHSTTTNPALIVVVTTMKELPAERGQAALLHALKGNPVLCWKNKDWIPKSQASFLQSTANLPLFSMCERELPDWARERKLGS